jgi:hypothetical protein
MRNSRKQDRNDASGGSQKKVGRDDLEDDLDALFKLPLAEFTGARNTLATRLKKSGRSDEAVLVKALPKPPVSAWAVNQLYWNHREAFDRLIASGERFHKSQTLAAKRGDVRSALDLRREALTHLSDLAESVLRDAGHNPALDTARRITSTLEALSTMSAMSDRASRSDAPRVGRLTEDVDPPGFDSLASWIPAGGMARATKQPAAVTQSQKPNSVVAKTRGKVAPDDGARKQEEIRKAKIAAAKVSLQDAKRTLTEARARAQSLEAAQKKAEAETKKSETQKRDAEEGLKKARAVWEDAARRARSVAEEVEEAASAVDDAERSVEKASKELESLSRESSGK